MTDILMLVRNNCRNDARVLKEAATLQRAGHRVRVLAVTDSTCSQLYEEVFGISVYRIKVLSPVPEFLRWLRGQGFRTLGRDLSRAGVLAYTACRWLLLVLMPAKASVRWLVRRALPAVARSCRWAAKRVLPGRAAWLARKWGTRQARKLGATLRRWGRAMRVRLRLPRVRLRLPRVRDPLKRRLRRGARKAMRLARAPFRTLSRWAFRLIRAAALPLARPLLSFSYYTTASLWVRKHPAQIYHCHDLNTLWVGYLMARLTRGRFVYDSHELNLDRARLQRLPVERFFGAVWERFLARRAAAVIMAGDMAADVVSKRHGIARPTVIMNLASAAPPVSPGIWRPEHEPVFSDTRFKVLYLGGITWYRGLEQTVQALATLDDSILFILMGPVHPRFGPELLQLARSVGVESRLSLLAPVPFTEVLRYAARADIGIVPIQNRSLSYYYCLPNKLFECIVAGLPVLASDFPELRRFVKGHEIGRLFDPASPGDIARAIRHARDAPDLLSEWRARAQQLGEVLNWEAQEGKLLRVYEALEGGRRRGRLVALHPGGDRNTGVEEHPRRVRMS